MKIKSLAAEAAIIRREERRYPGNHAERVGLRQHRIDDVRREQRASLLAYAFIRGLPYARVEHGAKDPPHSRISDLVHVFGFRGSKPGKQDIANSVQAWIRAGLGGEGQGVMTPGRAGSTPAARSNMSG